MSIEQGLDTKAVSRPAGPRGLLVFDRAGHVFELVMRNPPAGRGAGAAGAAGGGRGAAATAAGAPGARGGGGGQGTQGSGTWATFSGFWGRYSADANRRG